MSEKEENKLERQLLILSAVNADENAENNEWEEFHSQMDCCSSIGELLNVDKLKPDAGNHKRCSNSPN